MSGRRVTVSTSIPPVVEGILNGDQPRAVVSLGRDVTTVQVTQRDLPDTVQRLLSHPGARFADLFGTEGDPFVLRVVIALDDDAHYVIVEAPLDDGELPWLSRDTPAAFVEECELFEQFGLQPPEGHLLNRLAIAPVSSPDHPSLDEHAMPARDTHIPYTVEGNAFEFPFGPVRATGVESLYLGLVTSGEEVVDLFLHTWHKYRGIERRLRRLDPDRALFYIERGDGLSAVSSSVAFSAAVESALGLPRPDRVMRARAICLELERLFNHAQCAAALAQSTGLIIGQAQAERALEELLRLNAVVAGHRYLFGAVGIADGAALDLAALKVLMPAARGHLCRVVDGLLRTNSFLDRLEATGTIAPDKALALGLVGPIARACGQRIDVRVDHPVPGLRLPILRSTAGESGDALARLLVMRQEIDSSGELIEMLVAGEMDLSIPGGVKRGRGLGFSESARGETIAWVELDDRDRIARARLRTASARNWRAFDDAVRSQNVFTDVPIIEASFWLTVAGRVL